MASHTKLLNGFAILSQDQKGADGEESGGSESEEDDFEELDYQDLRAKAIGSYRSLAQGLKRATLKIEAFDGDWPKKVIRVRGKFDALFSKPWWRVTVDVKKARAGCKWDYECVSLPSYSPRTDKKVDYQLIRQFMSEGLGIDVAFAEIQHVTAFVKFLQDRRLKPDLTKIVQQLNCFDKTSTVNHAIAAQLRTRMGKYGSGKALLVPGFTKFAHRLFPQHVRQMFRDTEEVTKKDSRENSRENPRKKPLSLLHLQDMATVLQDEPWILGFQNLVKQKYKIFGCEATLTAFDSCDLLDTMPVAKRDALTIYDAVKKNVKQWKNTFVELWRLRKVANCSMEALSYLRQINVIGPREWLSIDGRSTEIIYLTVYKQYEVEIAVGLARLMRGGTNFNPPALYVHEEDFNGDESQLTAAQLIAGNPVILMSGKGGCGKTHVVSKIFNGIRTYINPYNKEVGSCPRLPEAAVKQDEPDVKLVELDSKPECSLNTEQGQPIKHTKEEERSQSGNPVVPYHVTPDEYDDDMTQDLDFEHESHPFYSDDESQPSGPEDDPSTDDASTDDEFDYGTVEFIMTEPLEGQPSGPDVDPNDDDDPSTDDEIGYGTVRMVMTQPAKAQPSGPDDDPSTDDEIDDGTVKHNTVAMASDDVTDDSSGTNTDADSDAELSPSVLTSSCCHSDTNNKAEFSRNITNLIDIIHESSTHAQSSDADDSDSSQSILPNACAEKSTADALRVTANGTNDVTSDVSDVPYVDSSVISHDALECKDSLVMDSECSNEDDTSHKTIGSILLTAPTGKAASVLSKRTNLPAYTLHHVIYSCPHGQQESPWKFHDVKVLICDECSLISVRNFHSILKVLVTYAKLCKVVLIGDINQLPSIEPGSFFTDVFYALSRNGLCVTLMKNHRTESQVIVENAERIARQEMPGFPSDESYGFISRLCKPVRMNNGTRNSELERSFLMATVKQLLPRYRDNLKAEESVGFILPGPKKSQFIAFERKICKLVNELCAQAYQEHSIRERGRKVFKVGDKVCIGRNCIVIDHFEHGELIEDGADKRKENAAEEDPEVRLCNGEIFFIKDDIEFFERGKRIRRLVLDDGERTLKVNFKELKQAKLDHAWARTIHTFQGSEMDTVVYVASGNGYQNWQHVYTAVTRGRTNVVIIHSSGELETIINREPIGRNTRLKEFLLKEIRSCSGNPVAKGTRLRDLYPFPSGANVSIGNAVKQTHDKRKSDSTTDVSHDACLKSPVVDDDLCPMSIVDDAFLMSVFDAEFSQDGDDAIDAAWEEYSTQNAAQATSAADTSTSNGGPENRGNGPFLTTDSRQVQSSIACRSNEVSTPRQSSIACSSSPMSTPQQSSIGQVSTPRQSSIGQVSTPRQSSIGQVSTPRQSSISQVSTPRQSSNACGDNEVSTQGETPRKKARFSILARLDSTCRVCSRPVRRGVDQICPLKQPGQTQWVHEACCDK